MNKDVDVFNNSSILFTISSAVGFGEMNLKSKARVWFQNITSNLSSET